LIRSVTARPISTLMIPAKQARKKMKICWLLRLADIAFSSSDMSCANAPLSEPPSHQSLIAVQYGWSISNAT
jgi:hypothetical protein